MDKFEIINFFEEHNFVVDDISQNPEEIALEIRACSGAGEDLSETIYCNNCEEVKTYLYNLYQDFDIEDHVLMWLDAKRNGDISVPDVVTLVHDAEDIKEMCKQLYEDFNNLLKDEKSEKKIYLFEECDEGIDEYGLPISFEDKVIVVAPNKESAEDIFYKEYMYCYAGPIELARNEAYEMGYEFDENPKSGIY